MERIYFDKQIFSYLRKCDTSTHKTLFDLINAEKHRCLFLYSHAHLLDLKDDGTEKKYDDLAFMQTIVDDNYIAYDISNKVAAGYLIYPKDAFDELIDDDAFSVAKVFDNLDFEFENPELKAQLELVKSFLKDFKFDFGINEIEPLRNQNINAIQKLYPVGIGPISILEYSEHLFSLVKTLEQDKGVYKEMRRLIDQYINNGKVIEEEDNIHFDIALKSTPLEHTFTDYIRSVLDPNNGRILSHYEIHTIAYFMLDLLGISKEPSKKVEFKNLMKDSYHSYYGAHSDIFVTQDKGLQRKSKALYKLFGQDVKVFSVEQFIPYFKLMTTAFEKDIDTFFKLLAHDIKHGFVIRKYPSLDKDRYTTRIKPAHKYIGYFNRIELIQQDGVHHIFLNRFDNRYTGFRFFREYAGLVNNAVALFGIDSEGKGNFEWPKEKNQISEGSWEGRFWVVNDFTVFLEINRGTKDISLQISSSQ